MEAGGRRRLRRSQHGVHHGRRHHRQGPPPRTGCRGPKPSDLPFEGPSKSRPSPIRSNLVRFVLLPGQRLDTACVRGIPRSSAQQSSPVRGLGVRGGQFDHVSNVWVGSRPCKNERKRRSCQNCFLPSLLSVIAASAVLLLFNAIEKRLLCASPKQAHNHSTTLAPRARNQSTVRPRPIS